MDTTVTKGLMLWRRTVEPQAKFVEKINMIHKDKE
jgi:hypothetical protein